MSYYGLFTLLCLGPMAVICTNNRWTPEEILSPALQCKERNPLLVAECNDNRRRPAPYRHTAACQSLKCAYLKPDGTFQLWRMGRPNDGTPCGYMQACRRGSCVAIDKTHVPTLKGIGIQVPCTS